MVSLRQLFAFIGQPSVELLCDWLFQVVSFAVFKADFRIKMSEEQQRTERVEKVGDLTVHVVGEDSRDKQDEKENIRKKEVMITFHDVGMNHKTCFERFFQHEDIVGLLDRFVIYHIDAPGQDQQLRKKAHGYLTSPSSWIGLNWSSPVSHALHFPNPEGKHKELPSPSQQLILSDMVCFGVGAGANVLTELAVSKWGSKIAGLVVVEPGISSSSFKEWGEG
ncbi:unnamed protein product, partial [Porites evermanni]